MEEKTQKRFSDEEMTIDLLELFQVLWHKAWLILLCIFVGAAAAFIYTKAFVTPMYKAKSMIYVFAQREEQQTNLTDLQIGAQLAIDLQTIATTREVVEKPIKELGLSYTYEDLVKKIAIDHPTNSRLLSITVSDPDARRAAAISNSLADALRYRIGEIMNTEIPALVESAVIPVKPSSPSLKKNVAIGGLLAAVLVCGVLIVIYMLDDTIKSEEDVEKYLGKNVLAVFPVDTSIEETGKQKKKTTKLNRMLKKMLKQERRSAS